MWWLIFVIFFICVYPYFSKYYSYYLEDYNNSGYRCYNINYVWNNGN